MRPEGLVLATALAMTPLHAAQPEVSGRWELAVDYAGSTVATRLTVSGKEDGPVVHSGRLVIKSVQQGNAVLICMTDSDPINPQCSQIPLRIQGAHLIGSGNLQGAPITLTGKRPAARPANAPRLHTFDPKVFHPVFSAAITPALRIYPGDTVRTRTIDADGVDEHGIRRTLFINPQTGPFHVEGAMPGDTLAVHFKRIRLNRDSANMFSSSVVAQALDPSYVRNQKDAAQLDSTWRLDAAKGTAILAHPSDKLKNFTIELQPMLGGVGVAPPNGQAIATFDLGVFGGNLDYQQIREGVTVYLPVFTPGALLFMGDAHARQGDAELTGTGLETSAEVEFDVELIENQSLGQPRAENADYVMVMGIGGSLSEALQQATTGLSRWLTATYELNSAEIAMVLGSSMEYDIAEIVDPHIHVVGKVRKSLLNQIAKPAGPMPKADSTAAR